MSSIARALVAELDNEALDALAEALAPRLEGRISMRQRTEDGWIGTKEAAKYLGLTVQALHRHTQARTIPFQQDVPGGKCWFQRSELDAWRRGEWQH